MTQILLPHAVCLGSTMHADVLAFCVQDNAQDKCTNLTQINAPENGDWQAQSSAESGLAVVLQEVGMAKLPASPTMEHFSEIFLDNYVKPLTP